MVLAASSVLRGQIQDCRTTLTMDFLKAVSKTSLLKCLQTQEPLVFRHCHEMGMGINISMAQQPPEALGESWLVPGWETVFSKEPR